jgi:hypothetical protein
VSVLFVFADVFTPSFVELTADDHRGNLETLRLAGVDFPFGEFIFTLTIVRSFNPSICVVCSSTFCGGSFSYEFMQICCVLIMSCLSRLS